MKPRRITLRRLTSWCRTDSGLRLTATGETGGRECFTGIEFLAPDVVHVRVSCEAGPVSQVSAVNPVSGKDHPFPPQGDEKPLLTIREECGELEVSSGLLYVQITKEPIAIAVGRQDEAPLTVIRDLYVAAAPSSASDVASSGMKLDAAPGEHFFGFGERFDALDQTHRQVHLISSDCLCSSGEGTYLPIPLTISTKGYGLWWDSFGIARVDTRVRLGNGVRYDSEDSRLDFCFINGPGLEEVITRYTGLTGRPPKLPRWAFGVLQGRNFRGWAELDHIRQTYRDMDLPLSMLFLDWRGWEPNQGDFVFSPEFPDPGKRIEEFRRQGVELMVWQAPWLSQGSPVTEMALEEGYAISSPLLHLPEKDKPHHLCHRYLVDLSNPKAYKWWKERNKSILQLGIRAMLVDFGEAVPGNLAFAVPENGEPVLYQQPEPPKARFQNGLNEREMANRYPMLYHAAVSDAVHEEGLQDKVYLLARSGWSGVQKYGATFTGDQRSSFEGMKAACRAIQTLALCGQPFVSTNTGGYYGDHSKTLFIRWTQMSAFAPLFSMWTGSAADGGTAAHNEPWSFDDETTEIFRFYSWLRLNFMPYTYSYVMEAYRTGLPLVRPLVLKYQDDPHTFLWETEYLFGDELLVAPVFDERLEREVWLPEGEWVDFWSSEVFEGPQSVSYSASLRTLPLFVKAGAVIPLELNSSYELGGSLSTEGHLVFAVYPHQRSSFSMFDDSGETKVSVMRESGSIFIETENARRPAVLRVRVPAGVVNDVSGGEVKLERLTSWSDFKSGADGWFWNPKEGMCFIRPGRGDFRGRIRFA